MDWIVDAFLSGDPWLDIFLFLAFVALCIPLSVGSVRDEDGRERTDYY